MSKERMIGEPAESISVLVADDWVDYELIDSGNRLKLERFGSYTLIRPEPQAIWKPALKDNIWGKADALFHQGKVETADRWEKRNNNIPQTWPLSYKHLRFYSRFTTFKHMGFFPEQASYWDIISSNLEKTNNKQARILNLFGYSGLASLAASAAGAGEVIHVDASKNAIAWSMDNQRLSGLRDKKIRYIVEDVRKFIRREFRRGKRYEGIIADPPVFGRGPQGEIWKLEDSLEELVNDCVDILSDNPLFLILTTYAIRASALTLKNIFDNKVKGFGGNIRATEMALREKSGGRILSSAISAYWTI